MNENRFTKQILNFFSNRETKCDWFIQVQLDLNELDITEYTVISHFLKRVPFLMELFKYICKSC